MKSLISRLPIGALGRGTLLSTFGLVARAVLQAGYLVIASRWLGVEGYGLFAGSVAAAIVFAPLAAGGMGLVFTERYTRSRDSARKLWSWVASQAALTGIAVAGVVLALAALLLPVRLPMADMALVVVAELVALPLVHTSTAALMAQRRVGLASLSVVSVPLSRVIAILILLMAGIGPDVGVLVAAHCAGTVVAAAWAAITTRTVIADDGDGGRRDASGSRFALGRDGAPYAFGAWAGTSYAEVDKVLVLQLLGAGPAGVYIVAYRAVSVLVLPINALMSNALPRLFAARIAGDFPSVLRVVALTAFGYSLLGAAAAGVLAALMPLVFGPDYAGSSRFVMMLVAWVPLAALHLTGANALLAAGGKLLRMAIEVAGLLVVAFLTTWLAPSMGAEGAVIGLLTAEAFMSLGCWVSLLGRIHSTRHR